MSTEPKRARCMSHLHVSLPRDLITEILSLLPVKSLVRFNCVCKTWSSLISDPHFVKKHLNLLKKGENLDNWRIVFRYPFFALKSCPLSSIFHDPFGYSVELDYPMRARRCQLGIVGSCDGLVCLCAVDEHGEEILFLWNPSTRESKTLPRFSGEHGSYATYGFGYSEIDDDYKVVKVVLQQYGRTRLQVYSLRTDSWKRVENDFPFLIWAIDPGKFVNGCLNWRVEYVSKNAWNVASFNLSTESFCEVPLPNFGNGVTSITVSVLEGCLCVLSDKIEVCVDVWVMREYGLKESWNIVATVLYPTELKPLQVPRSMCFIRYGGIVMCFGGTLVLYNIEEKTFRYPIIYGLQDSHEADVYMESLVSPNAYKGIGFDLNN